MPKYGDSMKEDALHDLSTGIYIVSTKKDEAVNGLTVTWATRTSMIPPLVAIAVGHHHHSFHMIKEGKVFCVNVIGEEHKELAMKFGEVSGKDDDKFEGVKYTPGKTGCPILKDCIAYVECKVIDSMVTGDHTMFIGEIVDAAIKDRDKKPLAYSQGKYL